MGKKATLGTHSWKWGLVCLGLFIFGCELSLAHAGLKTCTVAEDDLELTIILPPPSRMLGLQLCTSTPVYMALGLKPGVSCVYLLVTLATEPNP